jgi:hypothetical protein
MQFYITKGIKAKFKVFTNFYKSHWPNWLVPIVETLPCNSCTVLDGAGVESRWGWDFPASCTMGTGSFSGVNRPWRSFNHSSPPSAEVTESRAVFCSHSAPSWQVTGYLPLPFKLLLTSAQKTNTSLRIITKENVYRELFGIHIQFGRMISTTYSL